MIIACEMINQDGSRTDGTETISMRVWNVTNPSNKKLIYETQQVHYIDGGVWCFDSPIDDPENKTFLIIFENHEDIEGSDNLLIIGMIDPEGASDAEYAIVGAGQTTLAKARTSQGGLRVKNRDGKEILIKKKG